MTNKISDHGLFLSIVEAMSFYKAAERLNISSSALSRQLKRLEEDLGVTLLNRTTRSISLTPEGKIYHASCLRMEEEILATRQQLQDLNAKPVGKLKVAVTPAFMYAGLHCVVAEFRALYPEITFELDVDDRHVDLTESGTDVAIRIGRLNDSRYRSRRLLSSYLTPCASPEYLSRAGRPKSLNDLSMHELVASSHLYSIERRQTMLSDLSSEHLNRTVVVNDVIGIYQLVKAGAGISFLPSYLIQNDIDEGLLEVILPSLPKAEHHVFALFSSSQHLPLKTRAFVDYLANHFDKSG